MYIKAKREYTVYYILCILQSFSSPFAFIILVKHTIQFCKVRENITYYLALELPAYKSIHARIYGWSIKQTVLLTGLDLPPFSRVEFTFPTNGWCSRIELINLEGVMCCGDPSGILSSHHSSFIFVHDNGNHADTHNKVDCDITNYFIIYQCSSSVFSILMMMRWGGRRWWWIVFYYYHHWIHFVWCALHKTLLMKLAAAWLYRIVF